MSFTVYGIATKNLMSFTVLVLNHFYGIKRWKGDVKGGGMCTPPIPRKSQATHERGKVCGVQIFSVEVKVETRCKSK